MSSSRTGGSSAAYSPDFSDNWHRYNGANAGFRSSPYLQSAVYISFPFHFASRVFLHV